MMCCWKHRRKVEARWLVHVFLRAGDRIMRFGVFVCDRHLRRMKRRRIEMRYTPWVNV